jgi:hypothetical protein
MTRDLASVRKRIEQLARDYQRILHRAGAAEQRRLEDYRARLAALVAQYARAKPAPPKPLTIPRIFNQAYGENFISDYLAYVLDPGKNGIGEAPLARFLSLCGIDSTDLPLAEVTIHREYPLDDGRIDLLLEWEDTLVLGIENKILSVEGRQQTASYARVIRRLCGETPYHLIYLTRGGQRAGSRKFRPLSYAQLAQALREVQLPAETTTRRRVLWEDFLEHLEVYIVSLPDRFEFSEKAQLYLSHLDMIHDLTTSFDQEWRDAITYIERRLSPRLDGGPWNTKFSPANPWQFVFKAPWESSALWVYYMYLIKPADLRPTGQKIRFVAQADRAQREDFVKQFDRRKPGLDDLYKKRGIEYCPPHRRYAMARKEYDIPPDINDIVPVMLSAWAEFRFLETEIDQVLAEMQEP